MNVLVTGHLGFIGRHVFRALAADGHDVEGQDWPDDVRTVQWSEFDALVNLAAIGGAGRAAAFPYTVVTNNVGASAQLRETCECRLPHPRVIHVSSFSVYGDASVPTTEDAPLRPKELYGASKLMQELCWTGYSGPLTVLRLSSVYGRGMRLDDPEATVVAKIARAARDGVEFEVFEDGLQERDFVHVGDVVDCVRASLEIQFPVPSVRNVCSGRRISILRACELLGATPKLSGRSRPGDMRVCQGDPSSTVALLGREPASFEDRCGEILG